MKNLKGENLEILGSSKVNYYTGLRQYNIVLIIETNLYKFGFDKFGFCQEILRKTEKGYAVLPIAERYECLPTLLNVYENNFILSLIER